LYIEGRLAVFKHHCEAELLGEEVERRLDVRNEQLRLRGNESGLGCRQFCMICHGLSAGLNLG
jgi:hypothetical protein